jgi:NAD(P)-dependent dehydrogenase (short-subunit alcohol dehydrogenase family)
VSTHPVCNYLVCGASSGIGLALVFEILENRNPQKVFATHRASSDLAELKKLQQDHPDKLELIEIDIENEQSLAALASHLSKRIKSLDVAINCIGILQDETANILPERRLEDLDPAVFTQVITTNTLPTLLLTKHLKSLFKESSQPVWVSVSAKVGSITDNRLGGWHSYRISKAALNMAIKNISIEYKRLNKKSVVVAFHPGTTDTKLSAPFMANAKKNYTIHSPQSTAQNLLAVIDKITPKENGTFYSWDGHSLPW